jgi:hypothetical protein
MTSVDVQGSVVLVNSYPIDTGLRVLSAVANAKATDRRHVRLL